MILSSPVHHSHRLVLRMAKERNEKKFRSASLYGGRHDALSGMRGIIQTDSERARIV